MNKNEALMSKCIKNAYKAKGSTKTNPLVGAAVCRNTRKIWICPCRS